MEEYLQESYKHYRKEILSYLLINIILYLLVLPIVAAGAIYILNYVFEMSTSINYGKSFLLGVLMYQFMPSVQIKKG